MHSLSSVPRSYDDLSDRTKTSSKPKQNSDSSKTLKKTVNSKPTGKPNPVSFDDVFVRPSGVPPMSNDDQPMKKAFSCSNIRGPPSRLGGQSHVGARAHNQELNTKYPGSVTKIGVTSAKKSDLTASEPRFHTSGTSNSVKSSSNTHKTHITSNVLSRIEKEKQYEAQISRLTKLAESRKLMIKKLNFELQRVKKEAAEAALLVNEAKSESNHFKNQLEVLENPCKKDGDQIGSSSVHPSRPMTCTSPAESLSTSDAAQSMTAISGSIFSDLNEFANPSLIGDGIGTPSLNYLDWDQPHTNNVPMSSLRDRLLEMEEVNCSKTEELQATQQELWDLQRNLDEAHTETRSLAFQRDILRQALTTETSKVKHCRFQIEQLKHLLSTDRHLQTAESREKYYRELYYSVEREKQVLLDELAEATTDTVFQQCSILIEKASLLQDYYDALKTDYSDLEKAYEFCQNELSIYKTGQALAPPPVQSTSPVSVQPQSSTDFDPEFVRTEDSNTLVDFTSVSSLPSNKDESGMNLVQELEKLKDALAQEEAERQRELAEWRLHESDLLIAVQVANKIRTESEIETNRVLDENSVLKRQIDKLNEELALLKTELASLKEELVTRKSVHKDQVPSLDSCPQTGRKIDPGPERTLSDLSAIQTPAFISSTNSNPCRLTSSAMSEGIFSTRSSVLHACPGHQTSQLHSSHGSPGAPGRPSALTNGPKVRNVIQSIENRIKAAQHQKIGISANPSTDLCHHPPHHHSSPTFPNQSSAKPDSRTYANQSILPCDTMGCKHDSPVSTSDDNPNSHPTLVQQAASAPGGPESNSSRVSSLHFSNGTKSTKDLQQPNLETNHINSPFVESSKHLGIKKRFSDLGCPYSHAAKISNTTDQNTSPTPKFSLGSVTSAEQNLSSKRSFSPPPQKTTDTINMKDSNHLGPDKLSSDSTLDPKGLTRFPNSTTQISLAKPNMDTSTTSSDQLDSSFGQESTVRNPVSGTLLSSMDSSSNVQNATGKWEDPLHSLARRTGARSKYNALLRWCQSRVNNYPGVEITNLSSSWNNGLALCALLHSFVPSKIPWNDLVTPNGLPVDKRYCFEVAFHAAESDGILTTLGLQEMLTKDRPNWNDVMTYVTAIYNRYEANSTEIPGVPNS